MDVAHLGHLEMLTPKPEESLAFFVNVLGMTESGREGDSVYLRAWDDYERHTLKLTASKLPGMGHVAFRARSPQALERRGKDRIGRNGRVYETVVQKPGCRMAINVCPWGQPRGKSDRSKFSIGIERHLSLPFRKAYTSFMVLERRFRSSS